MINGQENGPVITEKKDPFPDADELNPQKDIQKQGELVR